MATLGAAFDAVRQGGPAALLIGGEAGVGKTRLISEFAAEARAAGARVLIGGCLELGADGLPFGPFTAMLRDLVREIGADELIGLLPGSDRATRELARLLPELAGGQPAGDAGQRAAQRGRGSRAALRGVPDPARAAGGGAAARAGGRGRALGRPVEP